MEVTFMLLADHASAENKLNLLGVFNRITATTFPHRHHRMALAMLLTIPTAETEESKNLQIRLVDEDSRELLRISNPGFFALRPSDPRATSAQVPLIFELTGVEFPEPGAYFWLLEENGTVVKELPVYLE